LAPDKKDRPIVCFVADYSILIGGKERQLLEIVRYMQENGLDYRVISLSSMGLLYSKLKESYADKLELIDRQKLGFCGTVSALRSFMLNTGCKLYHSMDNLSILFILLASVFLKIKVINGSIRHAGVSKSLSYVFDYVMLRLSSQVIANSREGLKFYKIRNGQVIYNAVDTERFIATPGSRFAVIMTANFSDYKDHKTFFDVTIPLVKTGVLCRVGLLGDGTYLSKWQNLVRQEGLDGFFTFHGHSPDVEKVLQDYGTGILCSTRKYREGISNSILEYMGSGLIVIASDAGATGEIVQDRVNGLMFKTEDCHDLKQKLLWALSHPSECDKMRDKAYLTLKERFSYEGNMQKLVSLYNTLG